MSGALTIVARAAIVDVEGTTTPIAFVHDVLFPYADRELDAFVAAHRDEPAIAEALRQAAELAGERDAGDDVVLAHLHRWLADDRKATPLKTLQGLIWAEGYRATAIRGQVYPDAADGLRRWHDAGVRLYVYSSGSVEAQRVLFGNSDQGDLSALFSGNFDTTVGAKREPASYGSIVAQVGVPASQFVFFSDVDAELDAAREAGLQTVRLMRPADTPAGATSDHPVVTGFDDVVLRTR